MRIFFQPSRPDSRSSSAGISKLTKQEHKRKRLTADPKEAVGAKDVLAIAAVAVVEEAEETNRVMSLMALMSQTRIEALQLKSGKP